MSSTLQNRDAQNVPTLRYLSLSHSQFGRNVAVIFARDLDFLKLGTNISCKAKNDMNIFLEKVKRLSKARVSTFSLRLNGPFCTTYSIFSTIYYNTVEYY